jgi:hypothetical protein
MSEVTNEDTNENKIVAPKQQTNENKTTTLA